MSAVDNILNGMARGFAFGVMARFNPFFTSPWCGCYNPLYFSSNPFMYGGFFPIMPQINMPIFDMTPPSNINQNFDFSYMKFPEVDFSDWDKRYNNNNNLFDTPQLSPPTIGDTYVSKSTPDAKETSSKAQVSDVSKASLRTNDRYYTEMRDFIIRELEGGVGTIKGDKGGKTNKGVSTPTYDAYRRKKGLSTQDVSKITDKEVDEIYYEIYKEAGVDKISNPKLALYVFAQAVNSGPEAAKKLLRESGGDLDKYEKLQRQRYNNLANNGHENCRNGWQNRVDKVKSFASKLPEKFEAIA